MDVDESLPEPDTYYESLMADPAQTGRDQRRALHPITRSSSHTSGKRSSREDESKGDTGSTLVTRGRATKKTKCSEGGEIEV